MSDEQLAELFPKGHTRLDDEKYTDLEHIPEKFIKHVHHIAIYAGNHGEGVVRADRPERLLPGSILTVSLAAAMINEMYDRYLCRIYSEMKKRMFDSKLIHCDETPFTVVNDGRGPNTKSYMWVYHTHEVLINALAHRDYLVNGSEVHIDIFDDRMEIYSPGGMADGIAIQDRDPLSVPSTRRNPLLADIFERLGYMERKGSGFGKIIDAYEFQVNYKDEKKPHFRSDRAGFVAVMPNLNYDVPQDVPQEGTLDERIMSLIVKDPSISTEQMAELIGVSAKTIKRHIKKMSNINFVGSGYSGHWEIEE